MADKDELLNHNYDGIQEYDNDLPKWWIWLFVITIVFGVWRTVYYHFGSGLLQEERLAKSMEELNQLKNSKQPPPSQNNIVLALDDKNKIEEGKAIYAANCVACHLDHGQGLVGPNLTDNYWIHGGKAEDILKVISEGVLDKGMLPWKDRFNADQLQALTAFVWSLNGTNPPNPKPAQGDLFER